MLRSAGILSRPLMIVAYRSKCIRCLAATRLPFLPLEEPMNAKTIGQMTI